MLRDLIFDLISFVATLVPMIMPLVVIAGLLSIDGWASRWQWFHWLLAAPVLYLAWLILLLGFWAVTMSRLGRRRSKPRYAEFRAPEDGQLGRTPEMVVAAIAYRRLAIISNLPLIRVLETSRVLKILVYRAYSSRAQFGKRFTNMGTLNDPDLTEIGDNVLIGGRAVVDAHAVSTRRDGSRVFVSAPVRIGNGVTVGGLSHVSLGCTLGSNAILETGSVLLPFSNIPPGEVWGGSPAHFLRKRTDETRQQTHETTQAHPTATTQTRSASAAAADLHRLVAGALNLPAGEVPQDLSADTCLSWDSLGQMAIAAALYDRYGVAVDASQVFRLRSLQDIEALLLSRDHARRPQDAASELPDDLEMLPLLEPGEATRILASSDSGPAGTRMRLVIGASFTAQQMQASLTLWGRAFGLDIDCSFTGFGRVLQDLLDPQSEFAANCDGVNVVLMRPEDTVPEQLDQSLSALSIFASKLTGSGQLLVGSLPPVVSSFAHSDRRMLDNLRNRWMAGLENIPRVAVLDFAGVVERLGAEKARSDQSEVLNRAPYSPQVYQDLGIAVVRQILSNRRSRAKVLAIDCDNTLWGGVLGEAGPDGIQLGSDGQGRSYRLLQEYLKALHQRGLLLVVLSKNEESDVRDVFENHPEMVLRPGDIAAWRVNWKHKSENLQDLAVDLGLGLDSFVFVDDDPVVRAEMKARVPLVHVVSLPQDHSEWCATLSKLWLFDGVQSTAEDSSRTRMMQEEENRGKQLKSAATLEEFLTSLELAIEVGAPEGPEWARVAQLTQRTNQFNSSLKRRTVAEVEGLQTGAEILILKARDRFGEYGLTGLAILRPDSIPDVWDVDTFLMSCRVLGRGIEDAFLHAMAETAARRGARILRARFTRGPRNAQVRDFFASRNFDETEENVWETRLSTIPPIPGYLRLHWREQPSASSQHVQAVEER